MNTFILQRKQQRKLLKTMIKNKNTAKSTIYQTVSPKPLVHSINSQWRRKKVWQVWRPHTNLLKFGQLIFRKVIKIIATICPI